MSGSRFHPSCPPRLLFGRQKIQESAPPQEGGPSTGRSRLAIRKEVIGRSHAGAPLRPHG